MKSRLLYNLKLVFRKPGIINKVIKNYFLLMLGKNRLRSVEIDLGYNCHLNCKHCYASNLVDKNKKDLSTEEIKKIIDSCIKEGTIHFLISGGEPLLYNHLYEIIDYINKKGAFSCIATNGDLLNEKKIKKLKNLDLMIISLDSSIEEIHDKNRKKGSFKKIIKDIEKVKKQGTIVFTSSVITKENMKNNDLKNIVEIGRRKNINTHFCFPVAMGAWKKEDVILNKKDSRMAKKIIKENDVRCCEEGTYFQKGCSAGTEKICINPYGEVTPCPYIQASYGNILKEDLKKILKRMRSNNYFNRINKDCLPAFNRKFIDDFMKEINENKKNPIKKY